MPNPITQAQPPLEFIPPAFNPSAYRVLRSLLPLWMHWKVKLDDIQVSNTETLVSLYQAFQAKKIRFMLAFRHPSTHDPYCMFHLLSQTLPQVAQQQGITLQDWTHAHFIYDRGIPLWAGKGIGWIYSQLGCTPIRRGRVDLPGLRSIRQLFTDGRFPMAAAPEGATNGHNEIVSPIEPGIAQFGFWCLEDLQKADRSEQVVIVPIGIQYFYTAPPWEGLDRLLSLLERESGLAPIDSTTMAPPLSQMSLTNPKTALLYTRLLRLGEHLLSMLEQFYTKFYHQKLPYGVLKPDPTTLITNQQLAERLQGLLNVALTVSEQFFGVQPKGTVTDRCRRLEQLGWDWIYREDVKQLEALSPVERGLADRIAEEASLRLWHMRIAETFVSVTGRYVFEQPTVDRFAETALLLWDMVTRIKGKVPFPRLQIGSQRVQLMVGEPIGVSDRWEPYQTNRRQAVAELTQDLQAALERMIL